jgi:membrane protein implicated in regulation of membrane protease activity
VTFLHLLVLVLGVLTAVVVADVLGHRGLGPWPVGLVALALVPVAGWLYSPWLAAFSLGLALGAAVVTIASWTRTFVRRRHRRREQARERDLTRARQLEGTLRRRR